MGSRYRLLARVEEGSYWESYRGTATDGVGTRAVLIRLFSPKASDRGHAEALAEFSARAGALGDPRALSYEEVGFVGGRLAAARPWVDGHHLFDGIRRLQSKEVVLPPPAALYAVAEAAQRVALAHRAGFAHGSLSPSCILLSSDGEVCVEGYGALQALAASPEMSAAAAKGHPGYRAPELKGALDATPAGDVFSLGAVAYELLTLRSAAPPKGARLSTKREGAAPPSRIDRRIHARIDPVILRAVDASVARRYAAADELAEELRSVLAALNAAPGPADLARFVRELFPVEVSVGSGAGGPVPIEGPFALEPVRGGARSSLSRAAPPRPRSVPIGDADDARTLPDLPAPGPADPSESVPLVPPAASAADDLSWDAPPGEADPAPRLRPLPKRGRGGAANEPKTMVQFPSSSASSSAGRGPSRPRPAAGREPVFAPAPGEVVRNTEDDWHAPLEDPAAAPARKSRARRRIGILVWLALCVGGALAAPAIGRRLGWLHEAPAEEEPAARPPGQPARKEPKPRAEAAPQEAGRPSAGSLSLQTDVPAQVFVDGVDTKRRSPLIRYPLAPGEHTVLLIPAGNAESREFRVRIASGEELKRFEKFEPNQSGR